MKPSTLFRGIAALVYHVFIKIVGVFLSVVEIGWFVVKPIAAEMAEWAKRWDGIKVGPGRTSPSRASG